MAPRYPSAPAARLRGLRGLLFTLLLTRPVHCTQHVENFNSRTDPQGSTSLVPDPSEEYIQRDRERPYLSPLPDDMLEAAQKWPNCAWQVATDPASSSFGYLDLNAYYHTLVIWSFEDDDVYRITGQFPAMRYMSYQSYVFTSGKPITSMLDRDIIPSSGKNPFSDRTAQPGERGRYEIFLTANGTHGYDNELRAKREGQDTKIVTVIFRVYDNDPTASGTRKEQFWGFADPPKVEHMVKARGKHIWSKRSETSWEEFPICSDFGAAFFQTSFTDSYPTLSRMEATEASCPMAQFSDDLFPSMVLFGAGMEKGYAARITSYTNFDTNYLYWCALEEMVSSNVVIRMQGKLPRTPHSLYSFPRVSEPEHYDVRYLSISTIDMLFPSPTYEEVKDTDIELFYSQVPDWDRTFSIVFAVNTSIASACRLYDPDSQLFLAWNDTYNYGLKPTRMPSLIYREILSQRRGSSLADLRPLCEREKRCGDGNFIRKVMREYYPQIDVWRCDPDTGVATVLA